MSAIQRAIFTTLGLGGMLLLGGCPSQTPPPPAPAPVAVSSPPPAAIKTKVTTPPAATPAAPSIQTEATIDGIIITRDELMRPLVDAYGLNMLLKLVELDLAKQQARRASIMVSQTDISNETQRYVNEVFKDDKHIADLRDQMDQKTRDGKLADAEKNRQEIKSEQQRLLSQLLDNKKLTRSEFDLAMET
ncbi:MAG: hypothetical protein JO353_13995, partial [Phycisphaerae bacterium]|nr:hypothetical protein [Phycisphaerae bacterium]